MLFRSNDIKMENIIIAKASYHLPFEYPADLKMVYYPSHLFPTYRDTTNVSSATTFAKKNYVLISDVYEASNTIGAMNRSLKEYSGDFSSYIQSIMTKDESEISS